MLLPVCRLIFRHRCCRFSGCIKSNAVGITWMMTLMLTMRMCNAEWKPRFPHLFPFMYFYLFSFCFISYFIAIGFCIKRIEGFASIACITVRGFAGCMSVCVCVCVCTCGKPRFDIAHPDCNLWLCFGIFFSLQHFATFFFFAGWS